jgi:hypothetical protein
MINQAINCQKLLRNSGSRRYQFRHLLLLLPDKKEKEQGGTNVKPLELFRLLQNEVTWNEKQFTVSRVVIFQQ